MIRIKAENISKKFKIGFKKKQSFLVRALALISGKESKTILKALDNISFSVKSGEILGIIGENGSGKSTLLRIIAGIYQQDYGRIGVNGKIISLVNLKAGLKERLTMRENIFLVGSLFGLEKKEIFKKFNSIIRYSDLENFVDTKVYQFSEGMKQRLAFSIAIYSNLDILLLDEIFEVGDEDFKEKSANKIKEIVKKGGCVILVSHDLEIVKRNCDRIVWMEKGKIKKVEKSKEIVRKYKKANYNVRKNYKKD